MTDPQPQNTEQLTHLLAASSWSMMWPTPGRTFATHACNAPKPGHERTNLGRPVWHHRLERTSLNSCQPNSPGRLANPCGEPSDLRLGQSLVSSQTIRICKFVLKRYSNKTHQK